MRQDPRTEPTPPAQTKILHPVLSSALSNLDIQLEDELARYRRQRVGAGRPARQAGRQSRSHQLDLVAVSATGGKTAALAGIQSPPQAPERHAVDPEPAIATAYKPTPAFAVSPRPADSAIAVRTATSPLSGDASETTSTPDESDANLALAQPAPNLDDYLESSEELLRSLATEEAEVRAERGFMQSLLTPLGLGSMLLLLLSSAMFGYVIMNPSSMGRLLARRDQPSGMPQTGQNPGQTPPASISPNLAASEFPDLSLKTLGTIDAHSNSSAATLPGTKATKVPGSQPLATTTTKPSVSAPASQETAPAAPSQAVTPAATSAKPPAPVRTYAPPQAATPARTAAIPQRSAPVRSAPEQAYRSPASNSTSATAASRSSSDYPVKVLAPYTGDAALEQSRSAVPDAYLRNFPNGAQIQLGAYGDAATAEAKAQELRNRGIPAQVYKP